jgi:D-alanine-D-alanine ligase-like ATP-grasp enzyme
MSVVGDGHSNVKTLVEEKNLERIQRAIPMHPVFKVDEDALKFLTSQGLNLNYVPAACETVFLSGASNSTVSADTILYSLNQVHPSYLGIVKKACMSVPGLHFSGVDIVIQDISQPASPDNHWLLELNTSPYITSFYYPWKGNTVDVAGKILDMIEANYPL